MDSGGSWHFSADIRHRTPVGGASVRLRSGAGEFPLSHPIGAAVGVVEQARTTRYPSVAYGQQFLTETPMTDDTPVVRELRAYMQRQIADLERQIADLERQNKDLRDAVAALLAPPGPAFAPATSRQSTAQHGRAVGYKMTQTAGVADGRQRLQDPDRDRPPSNRRLTGCARWSRLVEA